MTRDRSRVILLGIDGCPIDLVTLTVMPTLWSLRAPGEGAGTADAAEPRTALSLDGRSPLPSSTYPCFGTLLTGRLPDRHRVRTTSSRPGAVPGWAGEARVAVPTLFDACRAGGLRAAAVSGDHLLLSVLNAPAAADTWPPNGVVPPGVARDAHGYVTNAALRPHLLEAAGDPDIDFLFGQINEGDTCGHDLGPAAPETRACYAGADRLIAEVLEAARPRWDETLVVILSDHGMEPRTDYPPIDLLAGSPASAVVADVLGDAGAALVKPRDGVALPDVGRALEAVPGIAGWIPCADGMVVAAAKPGWIFAAPRLRARGYHGGPATARTFAGVTGGHPAAGPIARTIAVDGPHLADWAPTIACVLRVELSRMAAAPGAADSGSGSAAAPPQVDGRRLM